MLSQSCLLAVSVEINRVNPNIGADTRIALVTARAPSRPYEQISAVRVGAKSDVCNASTRSDDHLPGLGRNPAPTQAGALEIRALGARTAAFHPEQHEP